MTGSKGGRGVDERAASSPDPKPDSDSDSGSELDLSPRLRPLPIPTPIRQLLWGPPTLVAYALLVIPFVAGVLETSWMTPLALPGYLIYAVGTAIGNAISPGLSLWVYWVPFFVGCYGLAICIGYGYTAAVSQ